MPLHYEPPQKTWSSLPNSCLWKGLVFSPILPRVHLEAMLLVSDLPFPVPACPQDFLSRLWKCLCCLINTEQNHMWAGLHYAMWEDGLLSSLPLVKVFLFGPTSRGDIELHFISDWHWVLKIYCQCRHKFYSAEGILILPEISRSTWACQCQFLLYKQLLDPKAEFTVLFPCKCQM